MTVIAAGFDAGTPTPVRRVETRRPEPAAAAAQASAPAVPPRPRPAPTAAPVQPRRTVVFEDDLDVPDFLK